MVRGRVLVGGDWRGEGFGGVGFLLLLAQFLDWRVVTGGQLLLGFEQS